MNNEMLLVFGVIFVLFCMQSLGGILQVKEFRKAIRRVHQHGNVGIGQKRGFFFSGYLFLVACDKDGIITYAEILDGAFIFSKFHEVDTYLGRKMVGSSIYDFIEDFAFFDKKEWKKNKGYIQAMEAVARHLNPEPAEGTSETENAVDSEAAASVQVDGSSEE
ncbi:MAG: transcriptional regulator [Lachnospiraceae bacterium]|nr:transcriptional regulator [Lachnospiraceae bacterium]